MQVLQTCDTYTHVSQTIASTIPGRARGRGRRVPCIVTLHLVSRWWGRGLHQVASSVRLRSTWRRRRWRDAHRHTHYRWPRWWGWRHKKSVCSRSHKGLGLSGARGRGRRDETGRSTLGLVPRVTGGRGWWYQAHFWSRRRWGRHYACESVFANKKK